MKNLSGLACIAYTVLLAGASAQAAESFSILQDEPVLATIDLGGTGATLGDLMAFQATFTYEDGKKGVISGMITTVDIPDGTDKFFDRAGNIVANFGGIDTLVVGGHSVYATGAGEMTVATPQVRAITGGTGRFIGASGQVTTTRLATGEYTHLIELVD